MRRTPLLLAVAASGSLLLAGCGSAATPSAGAGAADIAPAAATADAVPLADGLLPAEQFAPGATVTPVTADQLTGALGGVGEHDLGSITVTPDSCVTALQTAAAALGDPGGVEDAAGQYAQVGFGGTAELLAVGGPGASVVDTLADAVAACPSATVDTPMGSAVITVGAVTRPALGDAAAVVPVSVSLTREGGPATTGSALLGVVSDGERLLTLVTGAVGTAPDPVDFETLLAAARQHADDTLG